MKGKADLLLAGHTDCLTTQIRGVEGGHNAEDALMLLVLDLLLRLLLLSLLRVGLRRC